MISMIRNGRRDERDFRLLVTLRLANEPEERLHSVCFAGAQQLSSIL